MSKVQEQADIQRAEAKRLLCRVFETSALRADGIDRVVDCIISAALLEMSVLQSQAVKEVLGGSAKMTLKGDCPCGCGGSFGAGGTGCTGDGGLKDYYAIGSAKPMIADALTQGLDTTGLGTVRDWAEAILEHPIYGEYSATGFVPPQPGSKGVMWDEMSFEHKGKRYTVETIVTKVEEVSEQ